MGGRGVGAKVPRAVPERDPLPSPTFLSSGTVMTDGEPSNKQTNQATPQWAPSGNADGRYGYVKDISLRQLKVYASMAFLSPFLGGCQI